MVVCHLYGDDPPLRVKLTKLLWNGPVIGSIVLPMVLYGTVLWQDRNATMAMEEASTRNVVQIFADNAENRFATNALIGNLVKQYIRTMTWDQIAQSTVLHQYLYDLALGYRQPVSIWLIDPHGMLRASSVMFPAPAVAYSDRDYFVALRKRDLGVFVGKTVRGKVIQTSIFNVAQRRLSANDAFDGVIVVSGDANRFVDYWASVNHDPGTTFLVRDDGAIVARNPPLDAGATLNAKSPLMQQIAAHGTDGFVRGVSTIDHQERLYAYEKIGNYPLYIGHAIDMEAIWRAWYHRAYIYGGFFLLGTAGLLSFAVNVVYQREQWRGVAQELIGDIAQREEAKTQLQQAQKLEALGQIAGQIAHDFGNILSVIVGSFDMLEASPGTQKFLKLGQDAADRGIKTVQSLLTIARRQPQLIEMFDLNAVVVGMSYLITQAIGTTIKLSIAPASTPCWIKADRNQTELAILNIIGNANDAMPSGGDLTITTRHDNDAPEGLTGEFIALAIADTGTGIPPEVMSRVFDPFYTTKPSGKGTGIGLSMVRNFAQASNGTVSIDSTPQGTTVTLWLPIG